MITPPGVMIYREIYPAMQVLSLDDRGRLLTAILDYAINGVLPDCPSGALAAIWAMTQPRIDADQGNYRTKVTKSRYAAHVRECKRTGYPYPTYAVWSADND